MFAIQQYIKEKLVLNKNIKSYDTENYLDLDNSILDCNINSFEDLNKVLKEFFSNSDKYNVYDILNHEITLHSGFPKVDYPVEKYFEIEFFNKYKPNPQVMKKIMVGKNGDKYVFQVKIKRIRASGFESDIIVGGVGNIKEYQLKKGDNLLNFLLNIKKATLDNTYGKAEHLMKCFGLIK